MNTHIACRSRSCTARAMVLPVLPVLLVLAGCAGPAAAPAVVSASPAAVTVSAGYALPADATVLGAVEGVSCTRPGVKATSTEAIERLKQNAAAMGATGITHMRVATLGVTPSCWYSFVAKGTAYR